MAKQKPVKTPNGTPTPTPMAICLFDDDDCLDAGVARVGKALGFVQDTEMLDKVSGSLAAVEDDVVASDGDVVIEPSIVASGLNRNPTAPRVKSDTLQQLTPGFG